MRPRRLLDECQIVMAGEPADINGAGVTGDYVSMANYRRCLILVLAGDGTAGSDLDVLLYQATDTVGTGAKVLNALQTKRIYTKQAATFAALQLVTQWTQQTQAVADEQWAPADSGEQVLIWGFEIEDTDFDMANNFDCLRADLSDPGAAKVAAHCYILYEPRYAAKPDSQLSALT